MTLQTLNLQNFRNFSNKKFEFGDKTTIIFGKNTVGKTNTLESIYLLSSGKSLRAIREEEMIKDEEEIARVSGQVATSEKVELEIVLSRETEEHAGGKRFIVNGVSRRLFTFAGTLKTVVFGPWDLDIITSSPSIRRRFLDGALSQTDRDYRRSLLSYEKAIRQRNKVLERIREGVATHSQLIYWDHLVIREGNYITEKREEFLGFLNLTPTPRENLEIYYDKSVISEGRLEQYKREEVLAATTLVGPHRDDIVFKISKPQFKNAKNLAAYGSRGEQRMGVLWAKLAELSFIEEKTGERPVLLLDDIFSELDPEHHEIVMEVVGKQQTILTTAEPREVIKGARVIEL